MHYGTEGVTGSSVDAVGLSGPGPGPGPAVGPATVPFR